MKRQAFYHTVLGDEQYQFACAPERNDIPLLYCITRLQATQQSKSFISTFLADFTGPLTFSLWDRTWSRSCHPRHSKGPGQGSSQHRRSHRCGSGAGGPVWSLPLSSRTAVAVEGNGKIYFKCGGASPGTWLKTKREATNIRKTKKNRHLSSEQDCNISTFLLEST